MEFELLVIMLNIEEKIFEEYRILYNNGYVNESLENKGSLFSSLKCVNQINTHASVILKNKNKEVALFNNEIKINKWS